LRLRKTLAATERSRGRSSQVLQGNCGGGLRVVGEVELRPDRSLGEGDGRLFHTHRQPGQAGKPEVFLACCVIIVAWAVARPVFGFSDTWQLVINTGTTIVTFLMVFLNTQNRDGAALHAKRDELIRVSAAQNHFIGIEHLTETELEEIRAKCEEAAKKATS